MAEHANHFADKLAGHDCSIVGGNNSKHGPDRLVNGVFVQTKYCCSPEATLAAFFEGDKLRWTDVAHHMDMEVPKDQYDAVLVLLKERISAGKVRGITDPRQAEKMLRKGKYTYRTAVQICKRGTVSGLTYDVKTGAVGASVSCGMSIALGLANGDWKDGQWKTTCSSAVQQGLTTGASSMVTHVATAQISRSGATAAIAKGVSPCSKEAVKLLQHVVGPLPKTAVRKMSNAAANNVVAATITGVLDVSAQGYHLAAGNITGRQAGHNVAKSVAGVAAGQAGWTGGATAGVILGSVIPGPGTAIGGFLGGCIGSAAAALVSNWAVGQVTTAALGSDDDTCLEEACHHAMNSLKFRYSLDPKERDCIAAVLNDAIRDRRHELIHESTTAHQTLHAIGAQVVESWSIKAVKAQ